MPEEDVPVEVVMAHENRTTRKRDYDSPNDPLEAALVGRLFDAADQLANGDVLSPAERALVCRLLRNIATLYQLGSNLPLNKRWSV